MYCLVDRCIECLGGVLYVRGLHCVVGRAVQCVLRWCLGVIKYIGQYVVGGLLCGRAAYCVLRWCTVCAGNVMYVRAVYWVVGWCIVC